MWVHFLSSISCLFSKSFKYGMNKLFSLCVYFFCIPFLLLLTSFLRGIICFNFGCLNICIAYSEAGCKENICLSLLSSRSLNHVFENCISYIDLVSQSVGHQRDNWIPKDIWITTIRVTGFKYVPFINIFKRKLN